MLTSETAKQDLLVFLRQIKSHFHVGLDTSQQIRCYGVAKDTRALVGGLHLNVVGIGVAALNDWDREVLHECGQSAEFAREYEVEEGPELFQIVLNRRARQDDAVRRAEALGNDCDLRVRVADLVAFV